MPYKNAWFWLTVFVGAVLAVCAGVAFLRMAGHG